MHHICLTRLVLLQFKPFHLLYDTVVIYTVYAYVLRYMFYILHRTQSDVDLYTSFSLRLASMMCHHILLSLLRNTQVSHKPKEIATLLKANRKLLCSVSMLIMYTEATTTNIYRNMAISTVTIEIP